ncbi:MAG: hybrid sensor histidine kinase/response regulator, partial [Haliea sp.]
LGMSIVRHLAELHGGQVRVESDGPGKGATVTLEIPALPAQQTGEDLTVRPDFDDADANLSGVLILVVEDEPQNREMLTMILRDRGARVLTAGDFDAALASLQQQRPAILVSDIGLPGRDGYDLIRHVRAQEKASPALARLPAIALTAFGRPEDVELAHASGFDAHLPKPLRAHELLATIRRLTGTAGR